MFPRVSRRPTPIPRPLRTTPCWCSTTRAAAPRPDRSAPFTPPAAEATRTMTTSTTGALASANSPTCTEATTTSLRHHRRTTERKGRTGGGGKLKEKTSKKQCGTFFLIAGRGQCAESKQWRNQYTLERQRMKTEKRRDKKVEGRSPWKQNQVSPRPSVVDGGGLMKEICLVLVQSRIFSP